MYEKYKTAQKKFWHPMSSSAPAHRAKTLIIARGDGNYITDIDGQRMLDGVGGLWNVNIGHNRESVKAAIAAQLDELAYYQTFDGIAHPRVFDLAERLTSMFAQEQMTRVAQALLSNYGAFREGHFSRQVTLESLKKMAERPLTGNPQMDANIRLAKELLRRPELVRALDRNMSTGASDGRLSRDDIMSVIGSDNPFKLKDDKQLIKEMLGHFQQLKGNGRGDSIKLDKLKEFAAQALTGNPFTDHLIQLAKEVMARSILQGRMDNVDEWQRDGKISRRELLKLLR